MENDDESRGGWNPPRLRKMHVRGHTLNDGGRADPTSNIWETTCPNNPAQSYRMPTSGEVGRQPSVC